MESNGTFTPSQLQNSLNLSVLQCTRAQTLCLTHCVLYLWHLLISKPIYKLVFRVYLDGVDSSPYDDKFEQFLSEPVMAVKHACTV